jgi:NitT/TauT family transport system substrate-binding protein
MRLTRVRRSSLAAAIVVVAALLASSCTSSSAASSAAKPEKQDLTVGVVPAAGDASLFIAAQQGLFAQQGLQVKIVDTPTAGAVIPEMLHGSLDVDVGQWTSFIAAEAAGVARFHALANASALGPHVHEILAPASSGLTSPQQLKGKKVAVNTLNGLATALASARFADYGISPSAIHFVAMPFPAMGAALAAHRVDAAYLVEPFVTQEEKAGGDGLMDLDAGGTQDFPISGYAVTAQWLAKYPNTAKAFTRAVEEGQQIAATNRAEVQNAVAQGAHLPPQLTAVMALGSFPVSVDPAQLQRVADLMKTYGQLKQPFNVTAMTG